MRFLWRTDVHLADTPPESRTDDWATTLMGKLSQVGDLAGQWGASAVLDGGDFFHIKTPSRTTHELIQRVIHTHRAYPCPVIALTGNHDVKHGDPYYLDEAPLGVLFSSGVFQRLDSSNEKVFEEGGVKVRVVGVPYHGRRYNLKLLESIQRKDEDFLVVLCHLLASEKGGDMFGGEDILSYAQLQDYAPDVFCFGHWHKNQGITQVGSKIVVNIGSMSRGALSEDDLARIPAVALLQFDTGGVSVQEIPLEVKPPEEVFDLIARDKQVIRDQTLSTFAQSLTESALKLKSGAPLVERVNGLDLQDRVRERVLSYLERARTTRGKV